MSELWGVTCHMGSYSVTCHPTQVDTPCLNPSQRPVLDLPVWRDGRLSRPKWLVGYIPWWFTHTQTVAHQRTKLMVHSTRPEVELQPVDHKSSALTTTPPSHLMFVYVYVFQLLYCFCLCVCLCMCPQMCPCVFVILCLSLCSSATICVMLCAYLCLVRCCTRLFGVGSAVVSLPFYFLR